jgi:hypothetical protein
MQKLPTLWVRFLTHAYREMGDMQESTFCALQILDREISSLTAVETMYLYYGTKKNNR